MILFSCVGVSVKDLIEPGVPVLEGESFVGEMDLARSAQKGNQYKITSSDLDDVLKTSS